MIHLRWFSALSAIPVAIALASILSAAANTQHPPVILYPPDGALLKSDIVLLMAITHASDTNPTFTLDGKTLTPERMAFAPTWAFRDARLAATTRPANTPPQVAEMLKSKNDKVLLIAAAKLTPGPHTFTAGSSHSKITLTPSEPPKDAPLFHLHQPFKDTTDALACESCHTVTTDSARILGLAKVPASCETCHDEIKVQLAHNHVLDSLRKCTSCHDPHGSNRPKLLIAPQEILCTSCHEAGHSKK